FMSTAHDDDDADDDATAAASAAAKDARLVPTQTPTKHYCVFHPHPHPHNHHPCPPCSVPSRALSTSVVELNIEQGEAGCHDCLGSALISTSSYIPPCVSSQERNPFSAALAAFARHESRLALRLFMH
ncbi:hypothetical protein COCMIDRAFT_110473, partial [Bipolaris oryzae ATCC 44560]